MRRFTTFFTAATLSLAWPLSALAGDSDIVKVIGEIRIPANQQAGDVSTVNGSVHIGDGARVRMASTVNGSVELGNKAQARSVRVVDGAVRLHTGSRVAGEVTAVNGELSLAPGADVAGKLSNVEGSITLDAAHVGGGIATVASNITLGANSHVEGGILVEKRSPHISGESWGVALMGMPSVRPEDEQVIQIIRHRSGSRNAPANVSTTPVASKNVAQGSRVQAVNRVQQVEVGPHIFPDSVDSNGDRKPKIVIGPHAVVQGTLDFRREVTLKVSDNAQIGEVKGATVERFSGASPW